ncbi:MAG: cache domain-containing protein [Schumannella sp.]
MSVRIESDAVSVVDTTFEDVFALIDRWRESIEDFVASSPVDVAAIDALVETLVVPDLSRDGALIIGAGFVAQPGFIPDAPWHLAWWLGHANTFGWTGPAAPSLRRLVAVEDEHAESFRDYTTLEWWRVPSTTGQRHITGPYVDYLCTDDYTLTSTVPAYQDGRMIGVVGADLYVNDIERALLPAVRGAGRRAALVNASGRVVVASDSSRPTGSLIRREHWAQHDRVIPCANGLSLLIDD